MKRVRYRFQFQYGDLKRATVTVYPARDDERLARYVAMCTLNARHAEQGKELPAGWNLNLIDKRMV